MMVQPIHYPSQEPSRNFVFPLSFFHTYQPMQNVAEHSHAVTELRTHVLLSPRHAHAESMYYNPHWSYRQIQDLIILNYNNNSNSSKHFLRVIAS